MILPLGKNVKLKLVPRPEKTGSGLLYVTERFAGRDPVAEVVAVGDEVTKVKPGMLVLYHANALIEIPNEELTGNEKDYAFCREDAIYAHKSETD